LTGTIATAFLASTFESDRLENDELDVLVQVMKPQPLVRAGADVIRAAYSPKHSTMLLAGVACSYKQLEDGSRQIHSFQYPGDFCDLYRYVLPHRDEATAVQALTDCLVATIDYAEIDRLLVRHPKLGLVLWRMTMLEASILRERLSNARRGSALQKVANLLCEQLARREAIGITSPVVPITQVDVADAVALSIVHVNRVIQTLRNMSVLSKTNRAIEVADGKELARIAEFDGSYLNVTRLTSKWVVQINEPRDRQNEGGGDASCRALTRRRSA
jgi:CRP-like cAMP-binding protein